MEGRIAGYSDGKIRGVTSMNGLTTPLYVIDGVSGRENLFLTDWATGSKMCLI